MKPLGRFHAHVYFDLHELEQAIDLRREIGRRFAVPIDAVYDRPIGPHSKGTFQIVFRLEDFGVIVPWLIQHRGALDVLVHGDTGEHYVDHTQHVLWLGNSQRLYTEMFQRANDNAAPLFAG
ncbi:MAG: DOPA 4,5-dioxygenase family protein [Gammaproteobacteria bacterium]|nr:DOPA 4,5-dioxygenase family protein [Gammaproteobacteria bacterium]